MTFAFDREALHHERGKPQCDTVSISQGLLRRDHEARLPPAAMRAIRAALMAHVDDPKENAK